MSRTATRRADRAAASHGSALTFETVHEADPAPLRMRPLEDTLLRVIAGVVRLTADGEHRLLGPGEEARIPAGIPHRLASAGGEARFLTGLRPATC